MLGIIVAGRLVSIKYQLAKERVYLLLSVSNLFLLCLMRKYIHW